MLVLSRKIGESIIVHNDVQITILDVQGGAVRVGVTAPAYVRVDREEVHKQRVERCRAKHQSETLIN